MGNSILLVLIRRGCIVFCSCRVSLVRYSAGRSPRFRRWTSRARHLLGGVLQPVRLAETGPSLDFKPSVEKIMRCIILHGFSNNSTLKWIRSVYFLPQKAKQNFGSLSQALALLHAIQVLIYFLILVARIRDIPKGIPN